MTGSGHRRALSRFHGVVLGMALGMAGLSAAWWAWESRWDSRLFAPKAGTTAENLSAQEAWEFLSGHPGLQVLDVRTPGETARGMLPGARRISWGDPAFELELSRWDRSRPVLVYCQGGYRSRKAVEVLRSLGFNSVQHLHRGMMAWRWAGKAVTDGESGTTPSR